jgi:hypothetical protein
LLVVARGLDMDLGDEGAGRVTWIMLRAAASLGTDLATPWAEKTMGRSAGAS